MRMSATHKYELEGLIDTYGLCEILAILAEISNEKAEHIRSNWQDEEAAKSWAKDTAHCDHAAEQVFS